VSDCCLTPNEQYEELDIYKNSGRPYNNTNFDKEDILENHKSFMSWLSIPINEEKLRIIYFILDTKISEESIFKQIYTRFFYLFNNRTISTYD
jgi:hypothetical protein